MAYNMSYSTLPTMTSNSIGGLIIDVSNTDLSPYIDFTSGYAAVTNTLFDVSLNPGAYIFTSSIVIYSGFGASPSILFYTTLSMNGTALSSAGTRIFTNAGNLQGSLGNCFAFNVNTNTASSISFILSFGPNNYVVNDAVPTGSWSLMRIG